MEQAQQPEYGDDDYDGVCAEVKKRLGAIPLYSAREFLATFPGGRGPGSHNINGFSSTYTVSGYLLSIAADWIPRWVRLSEGGDEYPEAIDYSVLPEGMTVHSPDYLEWRVSIGMDFLVPAPPGPGEDVRWPLQNPGGAIEVDCSGLGHCLLQRGLIPNREGDLIYALPVQMTGRICPSSWYSVGLHDIYHVLVPAHDRDGVRVEETEIFFLP